MPNKSKLHQLSYSKARGFTIIELVVVVVVIGILSAIVILSYSSWKRATISAQLKSDLSNVSIVMENYRNFNNIYPSSIPDNMEPSEGVVLYGGSNDGGETYCVHASNGAYDDLTFYITSSNNTKAQEGTCPPIFIAPPSTPTVTVALSSPNVLATASIVTCTTGTAQYGLRSRTNDGTWSAYSAWSTTRTASQTANDGVKYGYQAQARCYVDASNSSSTVTSTESTYIDPIPTPSAVTVSNSSTSTTTTWSWTSTACPAGTSARYQYRYTNSQGYDSDLVATTSTSISFTTSTESVTYTVSVQKQCYNSNTTSSWSTAASSSYTRPSSGGTITYDGSSGSWTAPTGVTSVTAYVWGGGGSGGQACDSQGGGGGGAFATKVVTVVPGTAYNYSVGSGGSDGSCNGQDSWFVNSSTVLAKGGRCSTTYAGGSGGQASSCIPTTGAYSGGNGGSADDLYGGAGGGSAGNGGNGGNGGNAVGVPAIGGAGGVGTYPGGKGGDSFGVGQIPGSGAGGLNDGECWAISGRGGRITLVW